MSVFANEDSERTICARAISDRRFTLQAADILEPADFYNESFGAIFAEAVETVRSGRELTPLAFLEMTRGDEVFQIAKNVTEKFTRGDVKFLLEDVQYNSIWRQYFDVCGSVETDLNPFNQIESVQGVLNKLADRNGTQEHWHEASSFGDEIFQPLPSDRLLNGPWKDLNEILPYKRGEMHLIAGRPSMGKSAMSVDLAFGLAENGHGVGFFAPEMDANDLMRRAACNYAFERCMQRHVAHKDSPFYQSLMIGKCTPEQVARARDGLNRAKQLPVHIDDRPGRTVEQIKTSVRRLAERMNKREQELRAVFVDHIGKVKPSKDRKGSKYAEMADISNGLHALAKDMDVAMIAMCQLSRDVERRGSQRPQLSDLRDAGTLEEDAYSVSFLYRPEYYLLRKKSDEGGLSEDDMQKLERVQNKLEVIVEKHRNGAIGSVPLFCDVRANAIRDPRHGEWGDRV